MRKLELEKLTTEEFSLRRLSELIILELGTLRQVPKAIQIYSEREGDEAALDCLRNCLDKGLAEKVSEFGELLPVQVVPKPSETYSFNLGHFLKAGTMLKLPGPVPLNAGEEYFPQFNQKDRAISYILSGSVVDHIVAGKVLGLIAPLHLDKFPGRVSIGDNYWSQRIGKKGVLKLEGHHFDENERGVILKYAPGSSINLISAGKVFRKYR